MCNTKYYKKKKKLYCEKVVCLRGFLKNPNVKITWRPTDIRLLVMVSVVFWIEKGQFGLTSWCSMHTVTSEEFLCVSLHLRELFWKWQFFFFRFVIIPIVWSDVYVCSSHGVEIFIFIFKFHVKKPRYKLQGRTAKSNSKLKSWPNRHDDSATLVSKNKNQWRDDLRSQRSWDQCD